MEKVDDLLSKLGTAIGNCRSWSGDTDSTVEEAGEILSALEEAIRDERAGLSEAQAALAGHGCGGCGDDSRACGCAE